MEATTLGLMARIAPLYPRGPIDVSDYLRVLPERGQVESECG